MRRKITLAAVGIVAVGVLVVASVAAAGVSGPFTVGSVNVGSINTTPGTPLSQIDLANEIPQQAEADSEIHVGGSIKQFHGKPVGVPTPAGQTVSTSSGGATGFAGLNHFAQRTADGGNQLSLEPPDQALCVGNGFVVEGVNLAFNVYTTGGTKVAGPVAYNPFFTGDHGIDRAHGNVRGWFLSDPKCYYDPDTNRFFMTLLGEAPGLTNGIQRTAAFIAVSKTADPTGAWWTYHFDTTDDGQNGTPSNPGCSAFGCLGDQPLIGADKYGFYITTNEFPFAGGFNGAQIYATSKTALETGTPGALVHFVTNGLQEGPAYSVQPATSPDGTYDTSAGGIEYFLSALEFNGTLDDRIAAWTLTNTSSLNSATPNLGLQYAVMKSEPYGAPPPVVQKPGDNPLGQLLDSPNDPLGTIQSNDDRMNQVVYANGLLWSGVNSVVQTNDGSTRVGIAWFAVDAHGKANGKLDAHVKQQGYVSVNGNNVLFPAIGVNGSGKAVMAFTLAGPGYYPSAAWLNLTGGDGQIHVSGAGLGPDDGFTQYPDEDPVDNGSGRWGDYGAAVAGPDGSIWLASEYIGQTCTLAQFAGDTTCGGTRTILANWGTFITHVNP